MMPNNSILECGWIHTNWSVTICCHGLENNFLFWGEGQNANLCIHVAVLLAIDFLACWACPKGGTDTQ